MPAKTEGMPKLLAAHVHALLVQTGMAKTAKKFEGEFGGEVRRARASRGRLDMRMRACGIGRACLLCVPTRFLVVADMPAVCPQLVDIDGTPTLMELYEKHIAPAEAPKKEKKGKKTKEEAADEAVEEEAPKRKKQAHAEDEEEPANKKKSKKSKKQEEAAGAEVEEEEKPKAKKPKQEEKPADEETSTEAEAKGGKQGKKGKGGNVPFQRIKSEEVTYLKVKGGQAEAARLLDNTFESKFKDGWANGEVREDYGAKASAILAAVRGKDFRHEKTKKKRGTYKGGPIDMQSNSIKFVNSSDEDE